jgi:flagellar motor protein MotB
MKNKFRIGVILAMLLTGWLASGLPLQAQMVQDTADIRNLPIPYFKNINKINYYRNTKEVAKIKQLDAEQNWPEMLKTLRKYVGNFGIQNFYKDTYYIWRLAKLAELYGDPETSKMYYRLVLKHHRSDIDMRKVELEYQEIEDEDESLFVPLEYYYELVEYRRQVDTLMPPRGVLLNMGSSINSQVEDYAPSLNIRNDLMIFTSKRNTQQQGFRTVANEDLFFSLNYEGEWQLSEAFKSINTQYNEGSATISRDGRTLVFSRCDSPDSYGSCDLFVSTLQPDSTWSASKNLGINVNSIGWDSHPSFSQTEDTLYFASDRIGGFGLSDIWFAYKNRQGEWMPAQNAGPIVNTRNNEVSPFIHPKYNILYFSSNGQLLNFGEFDIYKSYWNTKMSPQQWGEPRNIGPLVNGPGSEFYFAIDSESKDLFYAASKQEKMANLDLYSFPLPMGAQPLATTKFKGSLTEEGTNSPFKGIVSVVDLDEGVEIAPKYLRDDGSFEFDLIKDRNYLLIIQGDDFFRVEEIFYLDKDMQIERQTQSITRKLEFTTIDFESGSSTVTPEMYPDLNKLADFLIDHPNVKLTIGGHTDTDGDPTYNQKLSQQRAMAIMEYLVHFGNVQAEQVNAIGYGSSRPIIPKETSEEDKKLNRRVEFELSFEGEEG